METPLVSVIIRTCGRPNVLKRALDSVRQQTYPNIETVVIEDGPNVSEEMLANQYNDLVYIYQCTERKKGRCVVGNIGLEKSNGDYCIFLDDDDEFLPNHVEVLVMAKKSCKKRAVYSIAEERQFTCKNRVIKIKRKIVRYKQPFNRLLLCYMNYIPIQSILFEKSLYLEYGGFDEQLDLLEDWDLWLRYALENDFMFIPEITSVYYTPYKDKSSKKRNVGLKRSETVVREKHRHYECKLNAEQVSRDMDYILNVFNKKGFIFYMQKIRNYLLYRDV